MVMSTVNYNEKTIKLINSLIVEKFQNKKNKHLVLAILLISKRKHHQELFKSIIH